eukprot:Filipodium_phascolosomae@DN2623_c0_g2_i1.p1
MVDIIGVLISQAGDEIWRRIIHLVDDSEASVSVTLWGDQAINFEPPASYDENSATIVAIKGAKVGDFNGRSLSTVAGSQLKFDPPDEATQRVQEWYNSGGHSASIQNMSSAGGFRQNTERMTLEQLQTTAIQPTSDNDAGGLAVYGSVMGLVKRLPQLQGTDPQPIFYNACVSCNKKLSENCENVWSCHGCGKQSESVNKRFMLRIEIQDHTASVTATAFDEAARSILGMTPEESETLPPEEIIDIVSFSKKSFKIRAKYDTYQEERRLQFNVVACDNANWEQETQRMASEISQIYNAESQLEIDPLLQPFISTLVLSQTGKADRAPSSGMPGSKRRAVDTGNRVF